MSVEIINRWSGAVIYHSETATTIAEAVAEAVGTGAKLTGAKLTRADLTRANLTRADLTRANLADANLTRRRLTIVGSRHVVTAYGQWVVIGCRAYDIDQWLKHYREVGLLANYTAKQIAEYCAYLKEIRAWLNAASDAHSDKEVNQV
jgi:hypothetical protein